MTVAEYEARHKAKLVEYRKRASKRKPLFAEPPPPKHKPEPVRRVVWSEWVRDSSTIRDERVTVAQLYWIGLLRAVNVSASRGAGAVPAPAGFCHGGIVTDQIEYSVYVRPGSSEVVTLRVSVEDSRALEDLLRYSRLEIAHRRNVTIEPVNAPSVADEMMNG